MTRAGRADASSITRLQVRALAPGHALVGGLGVVESSCYLPASNEYELRLAAGADRLTVRMPAGELVSVWSESRR